MKTIHKYELPVVLGEPFSIEMPNDRVGWSPRFLDIQMQGDRACIWAMVDTDAEMEPQVFVIVGTGHELPFDPDYPDTYEYCGTFQPPHGLVFHLFELM